MFKPWPYSLHLNVVQVAADAEAIHLGGCAKRSAKGDRMAHDALSDFVEATAAQFGIPGVAVGVWADGREAYACPGVTSVDNPLPVDTDTLFGLGSVSKTFTATTAMRLVAEGRVELDAPVRRHVPELVLADERAAAKVAVLNLLNHTSGMDWGLQVDTGEGDDALATYVAKLGELEAIARPGTRVSYSQAGHNMAGRIVEKVTGLTFERAVASLVLEPLGLAHSFYAHDEVMTRRFAVGHNRGEDGTLSIARRTASSPSCASSRSATSPSSRCRTPARRASRSTRPWCAGRCRPIWG